MPYHFSEEAQQRLRKTICASRILADKAGEIARLCAGAENAGQVRQAVHSVGGQLL